MKYFTYVRNKNFTHALAALSPKQRYITAKRRWYAGRLGLYNTVLQHSPHLPITTRRHTLVSTIANIKRQNLSHKTAIDAIEFILSHKQYRQFHKEFIKEIISFYPDVILDFLKIYLHTLDQPYYQGLYIALLQKNCVLDSTSIIDRKDFSLLNLNDEYADKKSLYNNIVLNESLTRLANLNEIFNHYRLSSVQLKNEYRSFTVTNLEAIEPLIRYKVNNKSHKVTIIVTTYNASETIDNCIDSLLKQTWQNLEIIVIDDASNDDTLLRLQHLSNRNTVIKVIALPQNVGTFAAKSIGAQYATGEFLTCQDSDDWAHPQKIAEQVKPLIENASVIATTSHWLRLDSNGQYYARQVYPFMRQNPASPMFRLQTVKQKTGLWHIVRAGADSEFFERLKVVFGHEKIVVIKKPLTIASHRPNSLMTSEQFGIYNRTAALARLDYWEAWRLWHIDMLYQNANLVMPNIQQQMDATQTLFSGIPENIKVNMSTLKKNLEMCQQLN